MSQTPECRMFLYWKSRRRRYDYRSGEGASPLMQVARRFGVPIRAVRDAIEAQRGPDPVVLSRAQREKERRSRDAAAPVRARRPLAEIEADIKALPFSLPSSVFRRRLERLDAEWRAENVALFDDAVAALRFPEDRSGEGGADEPQVP